MTTFFLHSLVFLSFCILQIHRSFAFQKPLCRDHDRSALLQFKASFVFDSFWCDPADNHTILDSWKVGDDCCSWDGVKRNVVENHHVIGLDISNNCLYGSINSFSPLFRLIHLKSLNLFYNNFNLSRIPSGITSLTRLRYLNLTSSNFTGQIPSEILKLTNLVSLDLSLNPLMLQNPSLKDLVETFTRLEKLHLTGVTISSHVPQSLSNLISLSSLLLRECSLQGEFPQNIFLLPNLHALSLRYNPNLTGQLPEFDNVSSPLELLRLDDTNFSGQLPVSIGNLKSMGILSARRCSFRGVIPSTIGNLTNLDTLDLSINHFSGEIPSSLGNLFRLTFLQLSNNNFSHGAIPSSLRNLTRLTALGLELNQLTGPIPSWLGNFTQLTQLSFGYNQLQGPIPEFIFRLTNLDTLSFVSNNFSGSLNYNSLLQIERLAYLQLSLNKLSIVSSPYTNITLPRFIFLGLAECNLTEFPPFLRGQNELEYLNLFGNSIEGNVPNWLFTLERLNHLSLSNNYMTGFEKPFTTLSFPNLRILWLKSNQFTGNLPIPSLSIFIYDVSQNKFSGYISPLFCNLTSALSIDLSSNNLSGTLPPCIGNSALVLNLKNNSFSGAIPNKFTSGCKLKVMDFSQNLLDGKVPDSLANCSELEILNLNENRMNDVFPSWLGVLPHLRVLSLRSNQFHGAIRPPLTKFDFGRLQIIDLSGNNFKGHLPLEHFRNWVAMKNVDKKHLAYMQADTSFEIPGYTWKVSFNYSIRIVNKGTERAYDQILEFFVVVDLSSNKFEGEIPEIIGTLAALQSLNLSNNILTGHIPLSLGNLTMLEALDLSKNDLSGQIPSHFASSNFLAVFNVSHNSLTGPIPRGNQFDTFDNSSFFANPGLCGEILSKKCGKSQSLPITPSENNEEDDKESPLEFNWEIVLIGCGTGLVIGVAFGWALDTRKYESLVKKKFSRRHRRRRRSN